MLDRVTERELLALLDGYGYRPHLVAGTDPAVVHQLMAATLDQVIAEIRDIQHTARTRPGTARPAWPMIVLRTLKGWTGPKEVGGVPVEGTWRAHQVPLPAARSDPEQLAQLEAWMRSYRPGELFGPGGTLDPDVAGLAPAGDRRMSANQHANGGLLLRGLSLPGFRDYAVQVEAPARSAARPPGSSASSCAT